MSENKIRRIAINLKGETKTQFEALKKVIGLDHDTEVLRFLITNFYNKELKK